jgi:putative transposase
MYKHKWGIEPILRVLEVAPSTYYSAISRQPSKSKLDDEKLKDEIMRVFKANYCVYGSRKIFKTAKA